ncbi:MAG: alpha/beta fold hydrolase [Rhodoferax sp.]
MSLAPVQSAQNTPDLIAPWWLPDGHTQTVWPALFGRHRLRDQARCYTRERWTTPDNDFIDVDHCDLDRAPAGAPVLVLFHGLEGSSRSHYALALAGAARQHGLAFCVPHFRGCGGTLNRAPRAYHSGDHAEVDWMLHQVAQRTARPIWAVGVSLGGNALLRWAQEAGSTAGQRVAALAAVSAPLDLSASGHAIGQGLNRQLYTRMFLRTMKAKAWRKLDQYPGLFDAQAMARASTLFEFDALFTAPLHGFASVQDYWTRASALPHLHRIAVPTCIINARNDPFVPAHSLPLASALRNDWVRLWQPAQGGHVGFAQGPWPGRIDALPQWLLRWFAQASAIRL